jgi:hypothetical protein
MLPHSEARLASSRRVNFDAATRKEGRIDGGGWNYGVGRLHGGGRHYSLRRWPGVQVLHPRPGLHTNAVAVRDDMHALCLPR